MKRKIHFIFGLFLSGIAFVNAQGISEITVCEGETLELTAEPVANAVYQWQTSDNATFSTADLIRRDVTLDMEGEYSLNVSVNGCTDIAKVNIIVIPKPNAGNDGNLTLNEGEEPTEEQLFNALGGTPDTNGTWEKVGNTYVYTVTSAISCKADATATVDITTVIEEIKETIFIPNVITVDNNGLNDTWVITPNLAEKYPKSTLSVFNRWGNMVYEASPYDNTWKGVSIGERTIYKEKKLPTGTYFYLIKLNDGTDRQFKGWVYVITE